MIWRWSWQRSSFISKNLYKTPLFPPERKRKRAEAKMAVSRLLLPRPWHHHHLPKTGKTHFTQSILVTFHPTHFLTKSIICTVSALPISTRWCSSSSSGAAEKSSGSENSKEKERRAAAADKSDNSKWDLFETPQKLLFHYMCGGMNNSWN